MREDEMQLRAAEPYAGRMPVPAMQPLRLVRVSESGMLDKVTFEIEKSLLRILCMSKKTLCNLALLCSMASVIPEVIKGSHVLPAQAEDHPQIDTISADSPNTPGIEHEKDTLADIEAQNLTKTATVKTDKPYTAFSEYQKWFIVCIASAASFFSPLSGQIYFPVLPVLTKKYNLSSSLLNVSVTTYMIFQGLAPSFMGTFSDASGRRPAYVLAFMIYTGANIGLALQNSYAALLVLRCVQSAGSSGTVSFGYGVVADVVTTAERGKFMGPMAAGAMMGPALGPVIGGLLAQFLGWRAVFWFLVILCGSFLVVYLIFQPETHRKIVGDGSIMPPEIWQLSLVQFVSVRRKLARMSSEERQDYDQTRLELKAQREGMRIGFPNPLKSFLMLLQKDASMLIAYSGLMMFGNLVLMTGTPTLFPEIYGMNELQVGLCFL